MNRTALNLLLLGLAVALVSAALWQLRARPVAAVATPDRSDYVLRDFELVTLNDQGRESFTVRGPYLQRDVTGLQTERLVVLPDTEQARSNHRVTVTQGDSILAGTGLRADLKAKRFELLNQVKGRYVPR